MERGVIVAEHLDQDELRIECEVRHIDSFVTDCCRLLQERFVSEVNDPSAIPTEPHFYARQFPHPEVSICILKLQTVKATLLGYLSNDHIQPFDFQVILSKLLHLYGRVQRLLSIESIKISASTTCLIIEHLLEICTKILDKSQPADETFGELNTIDISSAEILDSLMSPPEPSTNQLNNETITQVNEGNGIIANISEERSNTTSVIHHVLNSNHHNIIIPGTSSSSNNNFSNDNIRQNTSPAPMISIGRRSSQHVRSYPAFDPTIPPPVLQSNVRVESQPNLCTNTGDSLYDSMFQNFHVPTGNNLLPVDKFNKPLLINNNSGKTPGILVTNPNHNQTIPLQQEPSARKVINSFTRMDQWKLSFNGMDMPVEKFMFQVEHLALTNGVTHAQLANGLHLFLNGIARDHYWSMLQCNSRCSWKELKESFYHRFQIRRSEIDIRLSIDNRKQRYNESFVEFYYAINELAQPLSHSLTEREISEILTKNMRRDLRLHLAGRFINSLSELLSICTNVEDVWRNTNYIPDSYRSKPMPRINSLSEETSIPQEEVYFSSNNHMYNTMPDIASLQISSSNTNNNRFNKPLSTPKSPLVCWNCLKQNDHVWKYCDVPLRVFCFGCGLADYMLPHCPHCNRPGNEKMGMRRSWDPHTPKTTSPQHCSSRSATMIQSPQILTRNQQTNSASTSDPPLNPNL